MRLSRLEKLRSRMEREAWEALLIAHAPNRTYMTGFTGSSGYALVTLKEALLFTDFRYRKQSRDETAHFRVIEHAPRAIETICAAVKELNIRRLGFEQNHLPVSQYFAYRDALPDVELFPTEDVVETLRVIKEEAEIARIARAAAIADEVFAEIAAFIDGNVTERDIAAELEYRMRKKGAASAAYPLIVVSGERTSLPHGRPTDKKPESGDLITMDFGANVEGYLSDLTRTVVLGRCSDRHKELYRIVLEANRTALAGIKPGMTGKEADALARDVIAGHGYGDYFGHGLGHGIGLEIHEITRLSQQSETVLEPGMVITVEPGIYMPGVGGVRIEDDILITDSGSRVLTHSDKQLLEL